MSEAVKKALEVAAMAGCQASEMCCGNGICEDAGLCLSGNQDEYAAAIAAFLRALPDRAILQVHGQEPIMLGASLHRLAAAVEQEARDAV